MSHRPLFCVRFHQAVEFGRALEQPLAAVGKWAERRVSVPVPSKRARR